MLKVELISATGKSYLLSGYSQGSSPVFSPEGSLRELVANVSRSDMARPGRPGVIPGRRKYSAIETTLDFYLHADDGEQMEQLYEEFRTGWSSSVPSMLRIEADHPVGVCLLDLYRGSEIPAPSVDAKRRTQLLVQIPVVAPLGLARTQSYREEGTVTVTNAGDVLIYPKIIYTGAGGEVTSPSGAKFVLPPVQTLTVVDLDPQQLRLDGVFPEGVAIGKTETWVLPPAVMLEWELLIANPWG